MKPIRREVLHLLAEISESAPEVRFGQLIASLSCMAFGSTQEAIWDMEDEQLLDALRQRLADLRTRQARVAKRPPEPPVQ